MEKGMERLTASDVARLCGVAQSTVRYWIRSGRLQAERQGRSYRVPREEFLFFLESSGQAIPDGLVSGGRPSGRNFRPVQSCWRYFEKDSRLHDCNGCPVYRNQVEICFTAATWGENSCRGAECRRCRYYLETYLPRIRFLDQISFPAAIYRDLFILGANHRILDLCGLSEEPRIVWGIEEIVHPDSLPTVISHAKRRMVGDPAVPRTYPIYLKDGQEHRIKLNVSIFPLMDPSGAFLILAEPENGRRLDEQNRENVSGAHQGDRSDGEADPRQGEKEGMFSNAARFESGCRQPRPGRGRGKGG
ncbi:MAG: helix-turn-helix domain-containing protein [Deltaproteobacteria bacterium]|nr:helix-turn-helix domain-containing protein [Deltaproteobacteria bacterium]